MAATPCSRLAVAFALSVIAGLVMAYPPPAHDLNQRAIEINQCVVVDVVLKVMKSTPLSATINSFCSDLLRISTITVPSTSTVTTDLPVVHATAEEIVTEVFNTVVTPPAPTTTATEWLGKPRVAQPAKRDIEPEGRHMMRARMPVPAVPTTQPRPAPAVPSALRGFVGSQLSTACSCLSLPTPTFIQTIFETKTNPAQTVTDSTTTVVTTVTLVSTAPTPPGPTTTLLGIASQCESLGSAPVNIKQNARVSIAGAANRPGLRYPVNTLEECCSHCYLATSACLAFTWGNFDNMSSGQGPTPETLSASNVCRVFNNRVPDIISCNQLASIWGTGSLITGQTNDWGIGPCTPDL